VVTCSIWSPKKGVNSLQRCKEKINGRASQVYNVIDSTTSKLDTRFLHSSLFQAQIFIK
jgi:hypothetical protein